jgi:hypothetical protein
MQKFIFIWVLAVGILLVSPLAAQVSRQEYIDTYKDLAIKKMAEFGIPASITLAQGLLESDDGNSELALNAKNHFGIKCHKGWDGRTYYMDDDTRNECFRKYRYVVDSYRDHSLFLSQRDRYASLFDLEITDYKGWARGLKKAGYATNPRYADLLIRIIEENNLDQFDHVDLAGTYASEVETKSIDERPFLSAVDTDSLVPIKVVGNRKIFINNGVKYIIARDGDDFYKIAQDLNIYSFQIPKYNDLKKKDRIEMGEILYVEKKKNRGLVDKHIVREGETMRTISQIYAVKLKKLYKLNGMLEGSHPVVGSSVYIR